MKKITIALVVAFGVTLSLAMETLAKEPDKKNTEAKPAEKEELEPRSCSSTSESCSTTQE